MTIVYIAIIMLVNAFTFMSLICWKPSNCVKKIVWFSLYVICLLGATALCCLAISSAFQNELPPNHYIMFAIITELSVADFTASLCHFLKEEKNGI